MVYGMEFRTEVLASWTPTPTTRAIRVGRHPDFRFAPTQFTFLSIDTEEGEEWRSMSLASSPTRPHLEYGVRRGESAWKRAFESLEPGDEVLVEGPVGDFVLEETAPAVLVAGGIGITPLKGMIEYATDKGLSIPMTLLYSNRDEQEIAFRKELEELAHQNPRLRILHTLTRPEASSGWRGRTGRIDSKLLAEARGEHPDAFYYVCGKPEMVVGVARALLALGIPRDRVLSEQFKGY